jgi:hypothetical protein
MNARLYDPLLGRFLSPDPFVQAPELSQNFNRYSYCLNNPLIYTDPDGEIVWFIPVIIGIVAGAANVAANWNNIDGFWQGFTSFAVGAGAGVAACFTGGQSFWVVAGVGAGGGALTGATNNVIAQTDKNFAGFNNVDWGQVGISTAVGGVSGFAGASAGFAASKIPISINGTTVTSPLLKSAIVSPIAAGAGHVAGGTIANLFAGQNFGDAFSNSFKGIGQSMAIGGAIGVGTTTAVSLASGINPINGNKITHKPTQEHHFATDKNKKFTPQMKAIASKYGLDLNEDWNKQSLPHQGRHPNAYHNFVLEQMRIIDAMPNMNQQQFINLFNLNVRQPVVNNPNMLYKNYWK